MTRAVPGLFHARLGEALKAGSLVRLVLAGPRPGVAARQMVIRPVVLKAGPCFSVVWREERRDVTKNHSGDEVVELCRERIGPEYTGAHLYTTTATFQLDCRDPARPHLSTAPGVAAVAPEALQHDRVRQRSVSAKAPWLHLLGVTNADGRVAKGMEAKFRQIHRFVELLDPLLREASFPIEGVRTLVDMGCGKGYLTFAACEHVQRAGGAPWKVRGIEVREELVRLCESAVTTTGITGLEFVQGAIEDTVVERADVLVALHACDTATDAALARGIRLRSSLILVAPCCQKEVRPQLVPSPVLARPLRHGIFRERHAEFATDAIRAELLEWAGYDTRVFEFISPEHTGKNLMIAAVRRESGTGLDPAVAAEAVRMLAAFYGIRHQRLAELIGFDLAAP